MNGPMNGELMKIETRSDTTSEPDNGAKRKRIVAEQSGAPIVTNNYELQIESKAVFRIGSERSSRIVWIARMLSLSQIECFKLKFKLNVSGSFAKVANWGVSN